MRKALHNPVHYHNDKRLPVCDMLLNMQFSCTVICRKSCELMDSDYNLKQLKETFFIKSALRNYIYILNKYVTKKTII